MKKASILGMLKISVDQMKEMINGLLASAKEKKKIKEPVNLFNLCHEVINMLKPSPNFEIFIKHDLPTVKSHRTSLKQVLQNIVGNALKFNDKTKPVIKIGCKEEKTAMLLGLMIMAWVFLLIWLTQFLTVTVLATRMKKLKVTDWDCLFQNNLLKS